MRSSDVRRLRGGPFSAQSIRWSGSRAWLVEIPMKSLGIAPHGAPGHMWKPSRGSMMASELIVARQRTSLPNKALLPAAWAMEAADSLRSRAAIMIDRRSRAPRR